MSKRTVLYARVSGDDRGSEGRNLAGQLDMGRKYAVERGYETVAELAEDDRGASGAAFELEQLNRIRDMARAGDFDVLVVREIDRLSRSLAKQLIVEEELKRAGVKIEYVLGEYPDTPEGRLNKHIKATIAEYEREKVVERTTRGRILKVEAGNVLPHSYVPYGYRGATQGAKAIFVIHEPEADIVRMIFQWYLTDAEQGGSLPIRAICRKLADLGIPSPQDLRHKINKLQGWAQWHPATIAGILGSETYKGTWHYRPAGREPLAVEVPAIVDKETWRLAEIKRQDNQKNARRRRKQEYLLAGRLFCGSCGYRMAGQSQSNKSDVTRYYRCPSHQTQLTRVCTLGAFFRAEQVEATVWHWIESLILNESALAAGLATYQSDRDRENAPLIERLKVTDDLLADNRAQTERLLDLYLTGEFAKDALTERKRRLETTGDALQRERNGLQAHVARQTLTPADILSLQDFARGVTQRLDEAHGDLAAHRRILELLQFEGRLAVEDGQRFVYAQCILRADRLSIVSDKTSATSCPRSCSTG
ncbi:MAG: recombinase family protein [Chloroflexi bacterium]|nr:recombinase family protein [Chloroflexota bacterium]